MRGLGVDVPEGAAETGQVDVEATMAQGLGTERDEALAIFQLLDEATAELDSVTTMRTLDSDQPRVAIPLPHDVDHQSSESRPSGSKQRQSRSIGAIPR